MWTSKESPVAVPAPGARLNLNCAGDTTDPVY